ncbi:MAG: MaoC family dehydratase N-terminal domain-containing protein [Dehalococcoidia bacterium]
MAESVITDAMRAAVGVDGPPSVSEVTTSGIRLFARAVGHTDLAFYDEDVAHGRGYSGLLAPPGFLGTPLYRPGRRDRDAEGAGPQIDSPYKRILNGGTTYEYFAPIIAGDVITSRSRITEFREREGSIGPMLITYRETVYTRQDGTMVAKMRGNIINY